MTPVQLQIQQTALQYGVDPALALAVAQVETGGTFSMGARGTSGEIGIFQLLPSTARGLNVEPTDQTQNIQGGISYLRQMLDQCGGNENLALMAYNSGPKACSGTVLPAAQRYAALVESNKVLWGGQELWPGEEQRTDSTEASVFPADWKTMLLVAGGALLLAVAVE